MGKRELIASLRAGAEEKARVLREDASKEVDRIVRDTGQRIAELRAAKHRAAERRTGERVTAIVLAARDEARRMGFEAARELAGRLYAAATEALPSLREENYGRVFRLLAEEIPRRDWASVRVNPADGALAREAFTGAEVVSDETVSGGLEVGTEGGMIRVDNTFEKRLERAWDDIVPGLMAALEKGRGHASP